LPAASIVVNLPWIVFGWQVIGAGSAFRPVPGQRGLSILAQLISLSFFGLLYHRQPELVTAWGVAVGGAGLIASLALFEWARRTIRGRHFSYIFSSDTPEFVCTAGPYAFIRNPFYASYLLAMISTALLMPTLARAAIVAAMVIYFTAAAMWEERKFARSAIATEYARYKERTGRFLPRLVGLSGQNAR
jgi:protein-S-isoprenylcysteine O-methyltransferase Ste14